MPINNLPPLLQAFDPLFPIGAYVLSGGMETYTQKGIVCDKATLTAFLRAQLHILPYGDLGIAAKAAASDDFAVWDNLCGALKQPYEARRGSEKLCARFLKAQGWLADYPGLAAYRAAISQKRCDGHYPVAVGIFIRDLNADVDTALTFFCYNMLSAAVNHAVKLVPLSQTDGQAALFEIMQLIPEAVQRARTISADDLGIAACGFDLRAMQHEVLDGRMYDS